MLPPVVEDSLLLGQLPLVVFQIVPVEDGDGDGQGGGDGQQGHQHRADVRCEKTENIVKQRSTKENTKVC